MTEPSQAVRIEGLRKSFGANQVLKGIDLSLAAHEVICLIGASGSGKSTLLRCVNLLEPINAGPHLAAGPGDHRLRASTRTRCAGTSGSSSRPSTCSRT